MLLREKHFTYVTLICLFLLSLGTVAQNQNTKWYFGNGAGLDFMSSPPAIIVNPASVCPWNSASVADAAGNLLFYTNGSSVYNSAHVVMTNGNGLFNNPPNVQQDIMIIPFPQPSTCYWIVTGSRYSIVDMSLSGGLGAVTTKNFLFGSFGTSGPKMAAVRHCDGKKTWVILHPPNSNKFEAYLFGTNPAGTVGSPIISTAGMIYPATAEGFMKESPQGNKLASAIGSLASGIFEVYDFNNGTGLVANPILLGSSFTGALGVEFSPSGRYLYGTRDVFGQQVYQWDLCAGSSVAVANSLQVVATTTTPCSVMQLAPDGAIYIARPGKNYLGKIANPDVAGPGSNFIDQGQNLGAGFILQGLLHLLHPAAIPQAPGPFLFTAGSSGCASMSFSLPTPAPCPALNHNIVAQTWDFGDPASGANNLSNLANPSHVFSGTGTYPVKLLLYGACGLIDSIKQNVAAGGVPVTSSDGFSICSGKNVTLTASGSTSYSWSNGAVTPVVVVQPNTTTTYTVTGKTFGPTGCTKISAVTITVTPSPTLSIAGNPSVCIGKSFVLTASGADSYTWNTGATGPMLTGTPINHTNFTVTGSYVNGSCISQKSLEVVMLPNPSMFVGGTTSVCPGGSTKLTVTGALSYTWSNGATGAAVNVAPVTTTTYEILGTGPNGCIGRVTSYVVVKILPTISVENASVCVGDFVTLAATPTMAISYVWLPGSLVGNTVSVSPPVTRTYTINGKTEGCDIKSTVLVTVKTPTDVVAGFSYPPVCRESGGIGPRLADGFSGGGYFYSGSIAVDPANGAVDLSLKPAGIYKIEYSVISGECLAEVRSSAQVTVLPAPYLTVSNNTIITEGASATLSVSGYTNYLWEPSDNLSCNDCTSPVASPMESTEYCVSSTLNSCTTRQCVLVTVTCDVGDLSIPNAFSPNDDGINDQFCLQGWEICITDFHINIYSRWGDLVFESNEHNFCWDGTDKGKMLNSDVFVYTITATKKKEKLRRTGNISLIR